MKKAGAKGKSAARNPKRDDPEQSKRFLATAKSLGAATGGEAFGRALDTLIPPKKPPHKKRSGPT